MNEKVNLPELITLLSEKANITKKDAESFLREFFDLMANSLLSDKQLKIKNIGTFKLMEVGERESVDVRTGERLTIPSHTKVSYIPDNQLNQSINEPFAMFEPIEVNDDATEKDPAEQESKEEKTETPVSESAVMDEKDRFIPKTTWQNKEPYRPKETKRGLKLTLKILGVIFFLLLIGLGAYWGHQLFSESEPYLAYPIPKTAFELAQEDSIKELEPNKSRLDSIFTIKADSTNMASTPNDTVSQRVSLTTNPAEKTVENVTKKTDAKADTKKETKAEIKVTDNKPVKENVKPVQPENKTTLTENKTVQAVTKSTGANVKKRIINPGERLTVIALEEYGEKIFWVYLYEENKSLIKNPGNVPAGLEIIIPPASKYGIDKNNPESLKQAAKIAAGIK